MEPGITTVEGFDGVALQVPRAALAPTLFQADVGGDHLKRGSWKRRRGMRHTDVGKKTAAIVSVHGFEFAGLGFGVLLVAGTEAHGHVDVEEQ